MTAPTHNRLKAITLSFDDAPDDVSFELQVLMWQVNNGTGDGDRVYTFGGDNGEFFEEADNEYTLQLRYLADWKSDGVADYFTKHDGETVTFALEAHTDQPASSSRPHPRWSGKVKIKAPNAGGEARAREEQEVEFPVIGKPAYALVTA